MYNCKWNQGTYIRGVIYIGGGVVLNGKCAICNHVQSLKFMKACNHVIFSVFTLAFEIDHIQQGVESRCRGQGSLSLSLRRHAHGPLAKRLMHMASSEVVVGLVRLYRISGRRVSRSLTFRLETKMPWCQTLSRKKKAVVFTTVTTNAYQGQLNAEFSKVGEIFKVRGIESLKYVREFHTVIVATFPRPETWLWTKRTVIGCLTCWSNGLMGGLWPMKAAIYSRPSAISLKVWLRKTRGKVTHLGGGHETYSHISLLIFIISIIYSTS